MTVSINGGMGSRPALRCSVEEARARINEQIRLSSSIIQHSALSEQYVADFQSRYKTWDRHTRELLRAICTTDALVNAYTGAGIERLLFPETGLQKQVDYLREDIKFGVENLRTVLSQIGAFATPQEIPVADRPTRRVFIISGQDERSAIDLERALRQGFPTLTPVVSQYEGTSGRDMLASFEDLARSCDFAFAVCTRDDFDGGLGRSQMRSSVLFEIGWFRGRHPGVRTCLLFRGDPDRELPLELQALPWIGFRGSIDEAYPSIRNELILAYGDDIS